MIHQSSILAQPCGNPITTSTYISTSPVIVPKHAEQEALLKKSLKKNLTKTMAEKQSTSKQKMCQNCITSPTSQVTITAINEPLPKKRKYVKKSKKSAVLCPLSPTSPTEKLSPQEKNPTPTQANNKDCLSIIEITEISDSEQAVRPDARRARAASSASASHSRSNTSTSPEYTLLQPTTRPPRPSTPYPTYIPPTPTASTSRESFNQTTEQGYWYYFPPQQILQAPQQGQERNNEDTDLLLDRILEEQPTQPPITQMDWTALFEGDDLSCVEILRSLGERH
jgi:hypothetical protein